MSAKAVIGGAITSLITSPRLRDSRRSLAGIKRKLKAAPAQVHYFHQTDDPYSHLMLQVLPALLANYQIELVLHAASIPTEAAAPDRVRLEAWSRTSSIRSNSHRRPWSHVQIRPWLRHFPPRPPAAKYSHLLWQ